jgi:hypothetical protein
VTWREGSGLGCTVSLTLLYAYTVAAPHFSRAGKGGLAITAPNGCLIAERWRMKLQRRPISISRRNSSVASLNIPAKGILDFLVFSCALQYRITSPCSLPAPFSVGVILVRLLVFNSVLSYKCQV